MSAPSFCGYNTKQSLPRACRLQVKIILHFPSVALSHFSVENTFTVAELAKVGTFTQERWLKELPVTQNRNVYSFFFTNIHISRNYHFKILESKGMCSNKLKFLILEIILLFFCACEVDGLTIRKSLRAHKSVVSIQCKPDYEKSVREVWVPEPIQQM